MTLTKDTDKMFCLIYQEFLNLRKMGESKSDASGFGDPVELQSQFLQGIHEDDILDAVSELKKNGLVKVYNDYSFRLTNDGIIYMESRFKNGLKEVLSYLSLLK